MLVHPSLVAAVLGGVDRRDQRRPEALREMVAGICNQPVVPVDEIEGEAIAKLDARRQHVGVHPLDPGDELAQVRRPLRLTDAVDGYPAGLLLRGRLLPATGEDVHVEVEVDQRLGQFAHVARQPALDQRRVFPGEDQQPGHTRLRLQQWDEAEVWCQGSHSRVGLAG